MKLYDKYPVQIFNSLSRKKEKFNPIHSGFVGLYVCGPTVYNFVHLGNARTFLSFDVVARYLRFLEYKVRYVRNITDVGHLESDSDEGEDKIEKRARIEKLEPMEVVQRYTDDFHHVMRQFNILSPNIEPSATGHIIDQINITKKLISQGLAYEVNGSIYFDVKKYNITNSYGLLSGRNIDELRESGRALDSQEEKRDKIDFALWKKASSTHIMNWPSPWGNGFPGWHIECTAMSTKYLGDTFDIHGGGMDLKFPHHECEIAQAMSANKIMPATYWMHTNMLTINGQKMSKSLGNSFLPKELFLGDHPLLQRAFSPMTTRFFMLQSHYSSTLDFSNDALMAAEKGYKKLNSALKSIKAMSHPQTSHADDVLQKTLSSLIEACYVSMSDDFNTAKTLAILFDMTSRINDFKSGTVNLAAVDVKLFEVFKKTFIDFVEIVLGLVEQDNSESKLLESTINLLIELRKKARTNRDFTQSDKIRDDLREIGVHLNDAKNGEINFTIE